LAAATVIVAALLTLGLACKGGGRTNRFPLVPVTATPAETPTLIPVPNAPPLEVVGRETRWRVYVQSVDRPARMPPARVTPTPDGYRERAQGQFVVVLTNVENVGEAVPSVSTDLGSVLLLVDASGREWTPLRGASAAYTLTLPGAPGNPLDARLQPARGIPYAFVFDVPPNASGLTFTAQGSTSRVSLP
jgi:hypothetical protein